MSNAQKQCYIHPPFNPIFFIFYSLSYFIKYLEQVQLTLLPACILCIVGICWQTFLEWMLLIKCASTYRISQATFLQLKIQLETMRFEPRTFQVPV